MYPSSLHALSSDDLAYGLYYLARSRMGPELLRLPPAIARMLARAQMLSQEAVGRL